MPRLPQTHPPSQPFWVMLELMTACLKSSRLFLRMRSSPRYSLKLSFQLQQVQTLLLLSLKSKRCLLPLVLMIQKFCWRHNLIQLSHNISLAVNSLLLSSSVHSSTLPRLLPQLMNSTNFWIMLLNQLKTDTLRSQKHWLELSKMQVFKTTHSTMPEVPLTPP